MNTKLKALFLTIPMVALMGCNSGQKSSKKEIETREVKTTSTPQQMPSAPKAAPSPGATAGAPAPSPSATGHSTPVIASPNPNLSGGTTAAPMSQEQMQGMMDQCMAMHKNTQTCSQRAMQDCQTGTDMMTCHDMMKNVKILRGQ